MQLVGIDLVDLDRFARGFPHDVFAFLRSHAPVWWHPPHPKTPGGDGPGVMLNMMDPPRHDVIRGLVSKGFKPSTIAGLEGVVLERTRATFDGVADGGRCDFLRDIAAELPLEMTASLFGVPQQDRHQIFEWTTAFVEYADRELGQSSERLRDAAIGVATYGRALIARKRAQPEGDMLSIVVHAEIRDEDGTPSRLGDDEVIPFLTLLLVAGTETTRDTQLGGQTIRADDKVTHWYPSANRDEAVFAGAQRFEVRRRANPHLAFGHGVHHCLGASLARAEIAIVLEAVLDRWSEVALDGDVVWARSNKHTGMRHLPVRFRVQTEKLSLALTGSVKAS